LEGGQILLYLCEEFRRVRDRKHCFARFSLKSLYSDEPMENRSEAGSLWLLRCPL
jgi:hypothetical protein